jgi:hypothetical protein
VPHLQIAYALFNVLPRVEDVYEAEGYSWTMDIEGGRHGMKRRIALLAAVLILTAASLALAGSRTAGDAVYSTARDGAQRALSATFSLSATVVNWICEQCPDESRTLDTSPLSSPQGEA